MLGGFSITQWGIDYIGYVAAVIAISVVCLSPLLAKLPRTN
jgi:hypothetical protein